MKKLNILTIVLCLIVHASSAFALNDSSNIISNQATIETAFSPEMGATALIVRTIKGAKKSIRVAAYSFTSRPIEEALKEAYHRGIDVKVVADKSNLDEKRPSSIPYLAKYGVPVRINSQYAIMHNKFMVIDSSTVETGSFNFTKAAETKNAENVIVLRNAVEIAAKYEKQWHKLWSEAEDYR